MGAKAKVKKEIAKKEKKFRALARQNRSTRRNSDLFLITDPKLFSEAEGTFVDYSSRKRVNVYLVPASWSRVIMIALIYAFFLTQVKYIYFALVGKPDLRPSTSVSAEE